RSTSSDRLTGDRPGMPAPLQWTACRVISMFRRPLCACCPGGWLLMACLHAHSSSSTTMTLYVSDDLGYTWTKHTDIWQRSRGQWLQGGAPSLLRLSSGRLLLPFHGGSGDQL